MSKRLPNARDIMKQSRIRPNEHLRNRTRGCDQAQLYGVVPSTDRYWCEERTRIICATSIILILLYGNGLTIAQHFAECIVHLLLCVLSPFPHVSVVSSTLQCESFIRAKARKHDHSSPCRARPWPPNPHEKRHLTANHTL